MIFFMVSNNPKLVFEHALNQCDNSSHLNELICSVVVLNKDKYLVIKTFIILKQFLYVNVLKEVVVWVWSEKTDKESRLSTLKTKEQKW